MVRGIIPGVVSDVKISCSYFGNMVEYGIRWNDGIHIPLSLHRSINALQPMFAD